jgi:putative ABC transport system ATP-binding protein
MASEGLAAPIPPAVSLSGVSFNWPSSAPIIRDLSLKVEKGERIFISGPSGCGKSTLLGLVAGILTPQKGEIRVNGAPFSTLRGSARDRLRGDNLGYIFQQFNLVPYLTPVENALLPCRFSAVRRQRALEDFPTARAAAERLLTRLSIGPELWGRASSKLSVGQQQRVAAARALIGKPFLLIADEPTSALDSALSLEFLRLLAKESAEAGASLLFVSHDKSLAAEFDATISL